MSRILRLARQQGLALFAVVLAMGSVAYAASLQLATTNTANKSTTLTNTGTGPALKLNVKAGQPPIAVNSDKVVPKLNASELQGKVPADFATAGSSYTKAQSDAKYALTGTSYTKAQSDAKYAGEGTSYTKVQSDAKYALTGSSYTTSQSDNRYPHVLEHLDFSGGLNSNGTVDVFNQTINVPGTGTALILIDRAFTGTAFINVYVAGDPFGGELDIPYDVTGPGGFTVRVELGTNNAPVSVVGHVTVLFIPD